MGPPHTPQLNGVAERFNRAILDRKLPSLFKANLPLRFWEDAACHAVFAIVMSLSRYKIRNASLRELWDFLQVS